MDKDSCHQQSSPGNYCLNDVGKISFHFVQFSIYHIGLIWCWSVFVSIFYSNELPTKYCYPGSLLWPKNVVILVDLNLLILWGPAPETSSLQLSQTRIVINALFLILKTSMHVVVWFLGGLQSPVTKTQDEKSLGSCLEKVSREIPGEGPASVFF